MRPLVPFALAGLIGLICGSAGLLGGLVLRNRPFPSWTPRWPLAFSASLAMIALAAVAPLRGIGVVVVVLVPLILIWLHEFIFLMRQDDDMFPGRYDKPIWALLLIVLPPVGVVSFWLFRKAHWPETAKPAVRDAAHDLS